MEFTGERYVPGVAGQEELYIEHMSRYRFVRGLVAGRRVLDVGSGCGYGAYDLATGGAGHVLGIDISHEAVAYSRRNYRHPDLCFAVMDASRLGLRERFGLVTCFELIEHVEGADAVLMGVRQVLDEAGVFIVSTPNKATYVAGGDGGANPFHVREYYREEFEDLLGSVFGSVRIVGQHWIEGMILKPLPAVAGCGETRAARLPEDSVTASSPAPDRSEVQGCGADGVVDGGSGPESAVSTEPPYFIALCAKHDVFEAIIPRLDPLAFYHRAVRYDALKKAALELEGEFDRRGEWALGLDREIASRDKIILSLQQEMEHLRNRFDERGRWAERLNGELRQSGALVERLAEENRRLRDSLAGRRPAGWDTVTK